MTQAVEQVRAYVERIDRLMDEKSALQADIKEIFAEAKGNGFDTKALRQVVKRHRADKQALRELDELVQIYEDALGSLG